MERLIIEGETGSGKTYFSIKKAQELGTFCYLAPCRQLVYETYIKYKDEFSSLSTGEIKITANKPKNLFAVYESYSNIKSEYDTIIIDEAHFLNDWERGRIISNIIDNFTGNIFLVTATRNFKKIKGFTIIKLKSLAKFVKREINYDMFWARVKSGEPSIIFRKYAGNCGNDGGAVITADTLPHERLQTQLDFTTGRINLIECTNVLAQGLNFPATNILIEYNGYDTDEVIKQKIGRLGRFGVTDTTKVLTYCLCLNSSKIKIKKSDRLKEFNSNSVNSEYYESIVNDIVKSIVKKYQITSPQDYFSMLDFWENKKLKYHELFPHINMDTFPKYSIPHIIEFCDKFGLQYPNKQTIDYKNSQRELLQILKNN